MYRLTEEKEEDATDPLKLLAGELADHMVHYIRHKTTSIIYHCTFQYNLIRFADLTPHMLLQPLKDTFIMSMVSISP